METPAIIVIGASSGGFAVLKQLVAALPSALPAALFVVWHMPSDSFSVLPDVLNQVNTLIAAHARDGEPIVPSRIYVAPPDYHMLVEHGHVRIAKGPESASISPATSGCSNWQTNLESDKRRSDE